MRQEWILRSLVGRVSDRSNALVVVLVGGMFCLFHALGHPPEAGVVEWAFPFVLLFAHLALSPLPWQWPGAEGSRVSLGRGLLQALLFNAAWVGALLALVHLAGFPGRIHPAAGWPPPPRPPFRHHPLAPGWGLWMVNVAFAIPFGWVFAEKEATLARERTTAGLLRQAQARALRNQLEPHVLYNSLNGLSELVHDDPLAAEEMIARLADLYRMLTVHGQPDFISLAQERALVEAYLAMEQMRLGDRLRVAWVWPPWADAVRLPPFLLQPLVENAIKHGISPCADGGMVRITCLREGADLGLRVENTGRPFAGGTPAGVGLGNLEARLTLWVDGGGSLALETRGGWTAATVRWRSGGADAPCVP